MSRLPDAWRRHEIPEAGVSVELYEPWPVESTGDARGGSVHQRIADTGGLVFLRYGEGAELEAFIATLSDFVTRASVLSEAEVVYGDRPARRVELEQVRQQLGVYRHDADGQVVDERLDEVRTLVSVVELTNAGRPVLVGYRLGAASVPEFRPVLERIVGSVVAS